MLATWTTKRSHSFQYLFCRKTGGDLQSTEHYTAKLKQSSLHLSLLSQFVLEPILLLIRSSSEKCQQDRLSYTLWVFCNIQVRKQEKMLIEFLGMFSQKTACDQITWNPA